MNENLDLVEILKDCPKGIELYSPIYGFGILTKVTNRIHVKFPKEHNVKCFRPDGKVSEDGEIMLFPKGKTTWEEFKRPFVDGDVVIYINRENTKSMFIYKEVTLERKGYYSYCWFNEIYGVKAEAQYVGVLDNNVRLATEDEKQKLFKAIQENGYKWNAESKTLEKLIEPKFKVGDIIRSKNGLETYKVTYITLEYYSVGIRAQEYMYTGVLPIKDQDDWILVPNKFDYKTLQPFDKVLVRDFDNKNWMACLFSHIDNNVHHKFRTVDRTGWYHCIPFNDDTKYLIGKTDEAPEFYRYWEE